MGAFCYTLRVTVYTVGHSTRSLDDFLALLAAHGVAGIADVRSYPASRRHPHFARAALAEALAAGERIELRGFGSFGVRHHEARTGRNPRTGAAIAVAAKGVPYFRAAKQLRAEVNRAAQTAPARAIG
jgi:nucleoid DNA-binding protein